MFYRIILDRRTAQWKIQLCHTSFLGYFNWWSTLKHRVFKGIGGDASVTEVKLFSTYAEADEWLKGIGLVHQYSEFRSWVKSRETDYSARIALYNMSKG